MEHAFGKITALFMALVMLCFVPMFIHLQQKESMLQLAIMQDTVQFVDGVRNMGVLNLSMYKNYENQIRKLQNGLEIKMVHTSNELHTTEKGIERVEKIRTEEEMVEFLQQEPWYYFQRGDYFRVEVKRTPGFWEGLFVNKSIRSKNNPEVYVYYGGSIRYEVK